MKCFGVYVGKGVLLYAYGLVVTCCVLCVSAHELCVLRQCPLCRFELQRTGETALYGAAANGHPQVVQLLIEAKADFNQATVCSLDAAMARGSMPFLVASLVHTLIAVDGMTARVCIV